MAKKPLSINLANKNSINRAIQKVHDAKVKVATAHDNMIIKLTENLVQEIKASAAAMLGATRAGESIHATYIRGSNGLLIGQVWGADYIIYIEYGTGKKGAENPNAQRPAGWTPRTTHMVNINGTKVEKEYWVYFDPEHGFVATEGQAPRPFIRKAVEDYRKKVQKKAEVAFYEWIAST